MLRILTIVALGSLLLGCVQFRLSQYDKITELVNNIVTNASTSSVVYHPYIWNVSIGDYQNTFIQVDMSGQYGFTNTAQEAIIFDNNRISAMGPVGPYLQKFQINEPYSSGDDAMVIEYTYLGSEYIKSVERCKPWQKISETELVQNCKTSFHYTNQITLDQDGNMIRLSQFLPIYNVRLEMQKMIVTTSES